MLAKMELEKVMPHAQNTKKQTFIDPNSTL